MKFSHIARSAAALVLAIFLLCSIPAPALAAGARSADMVAAALSQVGTEEGPEEYSKYGEWYGLTHSYWCDMFVSWCAMKANISASLFPRNCSCTEHVKQFVKMDRYQASASRGGDYIPLQGDVIFFYNYAKYPAGSYKNHTGIVLYVENGYVFTIEGNALSNRMDLEPSLVYELRDNDMEPPDYVTVNCYPLDAPNIHGYGIPAYHDRTLLTLEGFVDLGRHAGKADLFQSLCDEGIMSPTSSHTFSPNHGMTRTDFAAMTVQFLGLWDYDPDTVPFNDVPPESGSYEVVMAARSAGLVDGGEENLFQPDRYITPAEAREMLNRALAWMGLPEREFTFSEGELSYIVSPYAIRADIAAAFDELRNIVPELESEPYDILLFLDVERMDWPVRRMNGVCYVPLESLQESFPKLEQVDGLTPETDAERTFAAAVTLQNGGAPVSVSCLTCEGTVYVSLPEAAELLSLDMTNRDTIILTTKR